MIDVPAAFASTRPWSDTEATLSSEHCHVTTLFVAFAGSTFATSLRDVPTFRVSSLGESCTPVTAISSLPLTVTLHSSVLLPSSVVTRMIASPLSTAVTTPFSTVATASLSECHEKFLLGASAGLISAVRVAVVPFTKESTCCERVIPVTAPPAEPIFTSFALFPSASTTACFASSK